MGVVFPLTTEGHIDVSQIPSIYGLFQQVVYIALQGQ